MSARGREKVARTAEGSIVAFTHDLERVSLRENATNEVIHAWAPQAMAGCCAPGARATIFFDAQERVIGWHCHDERLAAREDYA